MKEAVSTVALFVGSLVSMVFLQWIVIDLARRISWSEWSIVLTAGVFVLFTSVIGGLVATQAVTTPQPETSEELPKHFA